VTAAALVVAAHIGLGPAKGHMSLGGAETDVSGHHQRRGGHNQWEA